MDTGHHELDGSRFNPWYRDMDIETASRAALLARQVRDDPFIGVDELRRMADAVVRVAEIHEPTSGDARPMCPTCALEYPCPTRRAIAGSLLTEARIPMPRSAEGRTMAEALRRPRPERST